MKHLQITTRCSDTRGAGDSIIYIMDVGVPSMGERPARVRTYLEPRELL